MVQLVESRVLGLLLVFVLLPGCNPDTSAPPSLEAQLDSAQDKYVEAQNLGFAWRANRISLEQAQQALEAGEMEAARDFIMLSDELADASLAQARREARDWQDRFPFGSP